MYTWWVQLPPPVKPMSVSRASPGPLTTADDRHGERRRDVREALLEPLDGLDDLKLLAGARRALDHCDATVRQAKA
jgi:hypothetical protein